MKSKYSYLKEFDRAEEELALREENAMLKHEIEVLKAKRELRKEDMVVLHEYLQWVDKNFAMGWRAVKDIGVMTLLPMEHHYRVIVETEQSIDAQCEAAKKIFDSDARFKEEFEYLGDRAWDIFKIRKAYYADMLKASAELKIQMINKYSRGFIG
jgi:hypothetical protein